MPYCNKCYKYHHNIISKDCSICQKLAFEETILCSLLQTTENDSEIDCFSYRPNLSIIDSAHNEKFDTVLRDEKGNNEDDKWSDNNFQLSNKHKWLKALALQKLSSNPDQIITDLNFHICLITKAREPLFVDTDIDLSSMFSGSGALFDGHLEVLAYGKDHIHLYATTSPDYSLDDVVNKTLSFAMPKIKEAYPSFFNKNDTLFETVYFAETIG
ncbi:MAG: hypothetical protein DSZ29_06900 [Aquificaceae bacterium]|nr:MAG: hypothetical protein DSZ29_06900 [Aquificaceae bacterium]